MRGQYFILVNAKLIFRFAGLIGGSNLQRILAHPKADTFEITALVRREESAKLLESKTGVKTVVGTLDDHEKLAALAESANVVFHNVSLQ